MAYGMASATSPVTSSAASGPTANNPNGTIPGMGMLGKMFAGPQGTNTNTAPVAAYSSLPVAGNPGGGVVSTPTSSGNAYVNGFNPTATPTAAATPAATQQTDPTYGTQSGPGILDQWFNERATGSDPAYEYGIQRGLTSLDNGAAARGSFDSGASMQQDSDFLANSNAQREGQLDALAAGASGENANALNTMFGLGIGLGTGGANLAGNYDLGAGNAMSSANSAGLNLAAQGAMIPYLANQSLMKNLFGLGGMALS